MKLKGDALGLLESRSIAAGVRAADDLLKAAPVRLVEACPISSGKFLVIFCGGVAEVEASLDAGRAACGADLEDELLLAQVHPAVAPAVARGEGDQPLDAALAIVETTSVASAVLGADAAAKAAEVRLLEIAPGRGIGGKGFFTLTGSVGAAEAAVEAARARIDPRGTHVRTEILTGPDDVLARRVARTLMRPPRGLTGEDE
ncbi:MAG TPA: BMC domain-containing protein [bacterium]|nr:BMC domain-containing protein [bacterium]